MAFVVLRNAETTAVHGSPGLLIALNFVFSTVTSLVVVFFIARSFLLRATPGLLLLTCGVYVWGVGTVLSVATDPADVNTNVTIYNSCACLAALCHLAGALVSLRTTRDVPAPVFSLATSFTVTAAIVAVLARSAMSGWMPAFFIQGQGGTPLRQAVLLAAVSGFVLTAAVFRIAQRGAFSPFARWYTLALILIATGLFGVLLQSTFGSVLSWTARGAQYLGGIYMLVAALASIRDSRDWQSSLANELSQARQRYEDLFHLAVDGIVVCEIPAGSGSERLVEANSALCTLLGYTLPEVRALPALDIVAPEERESLRNLQLRDDAANRCEITLVARDGRRIPTEVSMRIFRDRGVPTVMAIVRDITQRKSAEHELQELAQRLTWHVENSPLAVIEWGPDMRLTRWSGEAEPMFGRSAAEVLGKRIDEIGWIHEDDRAGVKQIFRDARGGKPRCFSAHRTRRSDGTIVHSEWHTSALLDENGNLRSLLSLVLDVTSRVEAERSLRKLNSELEQFAFAVSHDLQEPLRNVSIYSELLARRHGPRFEPQARQYVGSSRVDLQACKLEYSIVSPK